MLPPDEFIDNNNNHDRQQNHILHEDTNAIQEPHRMSHRLKEYQTQQNFNEIFVTETTKEPSTTLDDIFISVKTAYTYHENRLALILRTWFQLAKTQVSLCKS